MQLTETQIGRFLERVQKGPADACWPWIAGKFNHGYGRFFVHPKERTAHSIAFILANGPIPEGNVVCHKCDNPPCCNPNHLFAAPQIDNVADCIAKGRRNTARGEASAQAKVTADQVVEMRKLYATGTTSTPKLGRMYGISQVAAYNIVMRKVWTHI